MEFQLWRNATIRVTINGKNLLVDPMLGAKGSLGLLPMVQDERLNPLTSLPFSEEELSAQIARVDAVLLSHLHPDHWDQAAIERLDKNKPVICSPVIAGEIKKAGFTQVLEVTGELVWEGIHIQLTDGQHGTGEIGKQMGIVHGFVLRYGAESLYIAGDTIWCPDVKVAIDSYKPHWIIVNGGAPQFEVGGPITMTAKDIIEVCRYAPDAKVAVVHLESLAHCKQNRSLIRQALQEQHLDSRCVVPADGEVVR